MVIRNRLYIGMINILGDSHELLCYDTDTVAAVAGGLAGLYYGVVAISKDWLASINHNEYVEDLCEKAKYLS